MPKKTTVSTKKVAGITIDVLDTEGKISGKLSLSKELFGAKINPTLMTQAVRVYLANQRQGTVSTKTRSLVTGSTRKIYRQKGTGRARHGDIKAPIFIGGGVAHGPHPRDFSLNFPKKMRRNALFSALSGKLKDHAIIAVTDLDKLKVKTRELITVLQNLKLIDGQAKKNKKIMLVLPATMKNLILSARNIEGVDLTLANLLNTYEVLKYNKLVFLKDSFHVLEKTYLKEKNNK